MQQPLQNIVTYIHNYAIIPNMNLLNKSGMAATLIKIWGKSCDYGGNMLYICNIVIYFKCYNYYLI